ncbi:MAG TPA: hypothetical protein VIL15_03445 [Coriobacteriia bacterium]
MRRCGSTTPGGTEIALLATAALTSATLLFACVVRLPATAANVRAISARAVTAANARTAIASRPQPPYAHSFFAKQGPGGEPVSLVPSTRLFPDGADAGSKMAAGDRVWTPGEARSSSLARGQPCVDART